MTFNSTSKVLVGIDPNTKMQGIILPDSSKVISLSDVDRKIGKVKGHIDHLSKSQAHRKTHGGKSFRAKQISIKHQIDISHQRLNVLMVAKATFRELNKIDESNIASRVCAAAFGKFTHLTEGDSAFHPVWGRVTVLHAHYKKS